MPLQLVQTVRHTYDVFEVTAYSWTGAVIARRMYSSGSVANRRTWAAIQAEQWAEKFYLQIDETIYN